MIVTPARAARFFSLVALAMLLAAGAAWYAVASAPPPPVVLEMETGHDLMPLPSGAPLGLPTEPVPPPQAPPESAADVEDEVYEPECEPVSYRQRVGFDSEDEVPKTVGKYLLDKGPMCVGDVALRSGECRAGDLIVLEGVIEPETPNELERPDSGAESLPGGTKLSRIHGGLTAGPCTMSDQAKATVYYAGWRVDGHRIDDAWKRGRPVTFSPNRVIPGFAQALKHMCVGEYVRVWIPADQAYGDTRPGLQGPLVFDIELLSLEDSDAMFRAEIVNQRYGLMEAPSEPRPPGPNLVSPRSVYPSCDGPWLSYQHLIRTETGGQLSPLGAHWSREFRRDLHSRACPGDGFVWDMGGGSAWFGSVTAELATPTFPDSSPTGSRHPSGSRVQVLQTDGRENCRDLTHELDYHVIGWRKDGTTILDSYSDDIHRTAKRGEVPLAARAAAGVMCTGDYFRTFTASGEVWDIEVLRHRGTR